MSNSKKGQPTGATKAQSTRPTTPIISLSDDLVDHLQYTENVHKDRLMLRSWFMSEVLQADNKTTANVGSLADNVYLYELLDDFLSGLLENKLPSEL